MIEGIVEAVLSSIIIAIIFELWNRRKALPFLQQNADCTVSPPAMQATELAKETEEKIDINVQDMPVQTPANSTWSTGEIVKTVIRIGIAAAVGFILGGCSAGILEAEGFQEISLGSIASIVTIMIPTLVVWFVLYRFGPLKSK